MKLRLPRPTFRSSWASRASAPDQEPSRRSHSNVNVSPANDPSTATSTTVTSQSQTRNHSQCDLTLDSRPRSSSRPKLFPRRPPAADTPEPSSDARSPLMQRKIWVRRPGASPTQVIIHEDDLVDNVRDVILHKYSNSLGKSIDSPDITLKIVARDSGKTAQAERVLGPDESIGQTLESYYPGGQTIDEALIIDVPQRRTPRPSPRVGNHHVPYYYATDPDGARDYFSPMALHSPHLSTQPNHYQPSMAVLTTGQLPPLPSPGAQGSRKSGRPRYGRQHTSSPTVLHTVQPAGTALVDPKAQLNGITPTSNVPLPTPPLQQDQHKPSVTPPNRAESPRPGQPRQRRPRNHNKASAANLAAGGATTRSVNGDPPPPTKPASAGLLDGTVPPINVLIVEDNVINLKLLEAFMKRLKVRWKSAMNGKEAVATWRTGGFHLVLMDIQLPVMNGLEATKEIRRLEGANEIGVFSGSPVDGGRRQSQSPAQITKFISDDGQTTVGQAQDLPEEDKLNDLSQFKSPVIIVALTASSLQSDRHEALAAGCNDFLTKPVNFLWMERKVTEWGCMQALIDFDGFKKWKVIAAEKDRQDPAERERKDKEEKAKTKAQLKAMFSRPPPSSSSAEKDKEKEDEKEKEKEKSSASNSGGTMIANEATNMKKEANGTPVGGPVGGSAKPKPSAPWPGPGHKRRGVGSGSQTLQTTPEGDEE